MTVVIIAFHVYSIIQERTNELYFFVGDERYMMLVAKFLIIASLINLSLLTGAYFMHEKLFIDDEEGISWLHILSNFIGFCEILTLYLCAESKIEDCHMVLIKHKQNKIKVQAKRSNQKEDDSSSSSEADL